MHSPLCILIDPGLTQPCLNRTLELSDHFTTNTFLTGAFLSKYLKEKRWLNYESTNNFKVISEIYTTSRDKQLLLIALIPIGHYCYAN